MFLSWNSSLPFTQINFRCFILNISYFIFIFLILNYSIRSETTTSWHLMHCDKQLNVLEELSEAKETMGQWISCLLSWLSIFRILLFLYHNIRSSMICSYTICFISLLSYDILNVYKEQDFKYYITKMLWKS